MLSSKGIIIFLIVAIIIVMIVPAASFRLFGNVAVKAVIGVLLLFFFNVFGGLIGLHIPINIFTVIISSVLGLFGLASLAAVHILIL